jgi:transposase
MPRRIPVSECLVRVVLARQQAVGESAVGGGEEFAVPLRLGIHIACRAAYQVSLADQQGRFLRTGRRFRITPADLAGLWAMLPADTDPADVLVAMEPTRNAWVPLASSFGRRGAQVALVPPERSADLPYYAKHTKSDRLDSQLLARLPMLAPARR